MIAQTTVLSIDEIVSTPEICSGLPRVQGTRITVKFLATLIDHPDWPLELICEDFGLQASQVYAAWAYYHQHKAEIDAQLEADNAAMALILADPDYQARVAKLKNRQNR
jgi:uncharacterized protein (DUF433 family)